MSEFVSLGKLEDYEGSKWSVARMGEMVKAFDKAIKGADVIEITPDLATVLKMEAPNKFNVFGDPMRYGKVVVSIVFTEDKAGFNYSYRIVE